VKIKGTSEDFKKTLHDSENLYV